ncbi:MAG: segregation/condensation protein A [Firmicutes bacterium]|nr:segregation/condensation protein A [Bacillota bacterium]MDD4263266.1 segregation/condensation protein A [Bacillota bacterium]MDD4693120.1 segregation/condensation protein A [Bacillota bacterium]
MSIDISVKAFEGPLDLLLSLIKEKRIDIYDIPISEITKAYLEEVKHMEDSEYEVATEFIVMAATLMEIKAKMLLPKPQLEEDEEQEDPRTELVNRLILYKQFKEAAGYLYENFEDQSRVFARDNINQILLEELRPDHDLRNLEVSMTELLSALKVVLEAKRDEDEISSLPREQITIEDQINWLELYLEEKRDLLFSELFGLLKSKVLIVVTFMALLELVHRGVLGVSQTDSSEIYVNYLGVASLTVEEE